MKHFSEFIAKRDRGNKLLIKKLERTISESNFLFFSYFDLGHFKYFFSSKYIVDYFRERGYYLFIKENFLKEKPVLEVYVLRAFWKNRKTK